MAYGEFDAAAGAAARCNASVGRIAEEDRSRHDRGTEVPPPDHALSLFPELVDPEMHFIARLEENGIRLVTQPDPRRRAGQLGIQLELRQLRATRGGRSDADRDDLVLRLGP